MPKGEGRQGPKLSVQTQEGYEAEPVKPAADGIEEVPPADGAGAEEAGKGLFEVAYQTIDVSGNLFQGTDRIYAPDATDAATRMAMHVIESRGVEHARILSVSALSDDGLRLISEPTHYGHQVDMPWPPDPDLGPCASAAPLKIDRRSLETLGTIKQTSMRSKDGRRLVTIVLEISGMEADVAQRSVLDFAPSELVRIQLVPSQSDFVRGAVPTPAGLQPELPLAGEPAPGETIPPAAETEGADPETDEDEDPEPVAETAGAWPRR